MEVQNVNIVARDEMDNVAFDTMMNRGLNEAKSDFSLPISDVFAKLRQEISNRD